MQQCGSVEQDKEKGDSSDKIGENEEEIVKKSHLPHRCDLNDGSVNVSLCAMLFGKRQCQSRHQSMVDLLFANTQKHWWLKDREAQL